MPRSKCQLLDKTKWIPEFEYMAGFSKEINTSEDTEYADHALESEAAAHEDDEQQFPQSAGDALENY